jgi:hypothetical protein
VENRNAGAAARVEVTKSGIMFATGDAADCCLGG